MSSSEKNLTKKSGTAGVTVHLYSIVDIKLEIALYLKYDRTKIILLSSQYQTTRCQTHTLSVYLRAFFNALSKSYY